MTQARCGTKSLNISKLCKSSIKEFMVPTMTWEELGFVYLGPSDGHDIGQLLTVLEAAKQSERPVFIHALTVKGKGHDVAEEDAVKWHAVAPPGKPGAPKPTAPKFQDVFADTLIKIAKDDEKLVAITAAMPDGTSLNRFAKVFPDRCFDVGIAEQHAVTFAAGLACEGIKPVVAIYSTFLQRGYDQLIHDVALQNLPVVFALDRAGLVGADGPTHAGAYDIAYLRCIPNMGIACPADENETRKLLTTAYQQDHPVAVRYPRGAGVGAAVEPGLPALPFGKGELRRQGSKVAVLAFGTLLYPALQAAERLGLTVVNMRWAKPLDTELLLQVANAHDALVTVEEGAIMGGAGSAVLEALQAAGIVKPVLQLGLRDEYAPHGDPAKLLALQGLDAAGIEAAIQARFGDLLERPAPSLKVVGT